MGKVTMRPSAGNFSHTFDQATLVLEGAVLDLLSGGWDEDLRKLTCLMATALRQAARDAGWWDRETSLRAIESLVSLSAAEVLPIRQPVGVKLLDLLILLKKAPATRSA
jgi:hypothetical protein